MEKKRDNFFLQNKRLKSEKLSIEQNFKNKDESQRKLDLNRNTQQKPKQEGEKKPFDKKTYRLKKYSKKYKLEKWEEQRKKKMLHEYKKSIKNDPLVGSYKPKFFDEDVTDSAVGRFVKHPDIIEKELKEEKHEISNTQAPEWFNKKIPQKVEKQQEIEKRKQERKQKLEEYKKKKHDRFKKLSKKNKKGQPMMTGRLELLLEKIQNGK